MTFINVPGLAGKLYVPDDRLAGIEKTPVPGLLRMPAVQRRPLQPVPQRDDGRRRPGIRPRKTHA